VTGELAGRTPLRRDTIVEAARDLIRADGLAALSLRRLAAELGVTAPALYAHVADKRDLLRSVAEVELERLGARLAAVDADDPLARLRGYHRAYVDHARESPDLFDAMFLFPPDVGTGEPTGAELPAATETFATALAAVEDAVAVGALDGADPLVIALTLWTSAHGVAAALRLGLLPPDLEAALVDQAADRLLAGWAPGPPTAPAAGEQRRSRRR